jgi:prolyl oligopeptidase
MSRTLRVYPETRTENVQDTAAGLSFEDPYRWLEGDGEEVRAWQQAQSDLARQSVRDWPHVERLRQLVSRFSTERCFEQVAVPRYAAGHWFRIQLAEGSFHSQALVSAEPMGPGRVLFDARQENPARPPFVSWVAPSPDGLVLALGVCADGSENNTIRLIDTNTGKPLPEVPELVLMDANTGGVHWLPDSSGFFFSAIAGSAVDFEQDVYLHRRLPWPTTVPVSVKWTTSRDYRMVIVSRDGRYAVACERVVNTIPVAVASLKEKALRWKPFVTAASGTVAGHAVDNRYIAVTDVGAPRGRLVAIPFDAVDPNDVDSWQELVPESDAVLRTVTPVGNNLYLTEFVDTYSRVRIVDSFGKPAGEVPLPTRGAVVSGSILQPILDLLPKGHPDKFIFAFSSLTVSAAIYSHTPGCPDLEMLQAPQAQLDDAVVEERWAVSTDGTRIPYHLVRRADVSTSQPQPTLICAYGGFNAPLVPQFPGPLAAFIAFGGVYVHAHLRGGGEFGLDWWRGGRMATKQNCYQDLYAVAEDLIESRRTTQKLLAVTGESNGGLMAGVAVTQRPDLWAVVVPRVPLLDLIGACRDSYGRMAVMMDLANVEEPDEVRRLATFSPYNLVREGTPYPAVFIDAGNNDPRCPPWHARKFAARLQNATAGNAPIVLEVWENAGHGAATDRKLVVAEYVEWLAFTLRHLGLGGPARGKVLDSNHVNL